ncbi:MAG: hypothetical protein HYV36_05490 [Lentisphaerae bacterium]|nr:hypothetical protein [Lentisphaerota bacterium]
MNLQVDFLLDNERRSGSSVSPKFVIRLAAIIIPAVALSFFAILYTSHRVAKHDRNTVEQEKRRIDPEYKKVINLEKELKEVQSLMAVIRGWSSGDGAIRGWMPIGSCAACSAPCRYRSN